MTFYPFLLMPKKENQDILLCNLSRMKSKPTLVRIFLPTTIYSRGLGFYYMIYKPKDL